jgi:hypothetical protein
MKNLTLKQRHLAAMDKENLAIEEESTTTLAEWENRILSAQILELREFLIENSSHKTNYAFLIDEANK